VSSGQNAWEQNQREFDYQQGLKAIDADLAGRASAAASARADAQSRLALQLQEMQLRYQADVRDQGRYLADIDSDVARAKGGILMGEWDRLWKTGAFDVPSVMASWDPSSGLYRTSDGRYFDANGNPTSWSPQSSAPSYGGGGGGGESAPFYSYPLGSNENPMIPDVTNVGPYAAI
jgi:hypothetical protein